MDDKEKKSNILFEKAMEYYNKQEYQEALKCFEACIKYHPNDRAELFIKVCRNNIPSNTNSNSSSYKETSGGDTNKKKSYSTNSTSGFSRENSSASYSSTNSENQSNDTESDDQKCKKLLQKKDYYELLNLTKEATQDDIKRGYKKQAVRFHPDKNHSKLAEECFKKISEAYQCLSNPEKKEFYDKYGNEAEFREKYYQAHRQYEEEMDAFDIFDILFGADPRFTARRRGARRRYANYNNENANVNAGGNRKYLMVMQMLPVLLMLLTFILPNLMSFFESKPLYQFTRNNNYAHRRKTSLNHVEFYVGDKFIKKYPKMKDFEPIEPSIERNYLNYLYDICSQVIQQKNTYQYYMAYSYSRYEKEIYRRKLEQLNYTPCEKYNQLKEVIR